MPSQRFISDTTSDTTTSHGADNGEKTTELLIFLFIFSALTIGAALRAFSKATRIPYSPLILGIGILVGALADKTDLLGEATNQVVHINPHGFLTLFIPALIFESAFNVEWHVFKREIWGILIIAGPGVVISVLLFAVFLKTFLDYDNDSLRWYDALTIGSIIAPSDPIAAVALLKDLGAPATLSTILEGASLTNDGSAMVFFTIFAELAKGGHLSVGDAVIRFVRLAGGGCLLGLAFGILGTYLFSKINHDNKLLTTISFVLAYFSFYVAENTDLYVSGVLSTVTMGVYMAANARVRLTQEAEEELLKVWEWGQYVVETLIFFVTGAIIGVNTTTTNFVFGSDWWKMIVFYILMNLGRLFMIMLLRPIISRCGYGLNWREALVLSWGGLRGALGIALSLIIEVDHSYPDRLRKLSVFYMADMVILTLFVNGLTAGFLIKGLKITKIPEIKKKFEQSLFNQLALESNETIEKLQYSEYLRLCDWEKVRSVVGYDEMIKKVNESRKSGSSTIKPQKKKKFLKKTNKVGSLAMQNPLEKLNVDSESPLTTTRLFSETEIEYEARFRLLTIIRVMVLEKHEEGIVSSDAMRELREACNFNLDDSRKPIWIWDILLQHFYNKRLMSFMMKLKDCRFHIGTLARKFVGERLYLVYDCTSTLVMISEELLSYQDELPFMQNSVKKIITELQDMRNKATSYLEDLEERFLGIIRDVQIRRASAQILHRNMKLLDKFLKEGKITEGEYEKMLGHIHKKFSKMSRIGYDWMNNSDIRDFISKFPVFTHLNKEESEALRKQCLEIQLEKNTYLFSRGQVVESLFISSQGLLIEEFGDAHEERRTLGSVLSFGNVISKGHRAEVTVTVSGEHCSVYRIPMSFIRGLMAKSSEFSHSIYKHALYDLVRVYPNEAGDLVYIAKDEMAMTHFAHQGQVLDIEKGKEFSLENGGYVFEGRIRLTNKEVDDVFRKEEKLEQSDSPNAVLKKLKTQGGRSARDSSNTAVQSAAPSMLHNKTSSMIKISQDTSKWGLLKNLSKKLLNGEEITVKDHNIEFGKYSYSPPSNHILVVTEDTKILKFYGNLSTITNSSGENLLQLGAEQKRLQKAHKRHSGDDNVQMNSVKGHSRNLYSNFIFDAEVEKRLEDVQQKEIKRKKNAKLRAYSTVIKSALALSRLRKAIGVKEPPPNLSPTEKDIELGLMRMKSSEHLIDDDNLVEEINRTAKKTQSKKHISQSSLLSKEERKSARFMEDDSSKTIIFYQKEGVLPIGISSTSSRRRKQVDQSSITPNDDLQDEMDIILSPKGVPNKQLGPDDGEYEDYEL